MKKVILKNLFFCILLMTVLSITYSVFSFKFADGNQIMKDFYRLDKNTVDVLILGSSHAYTNFNNGTLWDEYGIASYNLGSSEQPLWNTYYYLKEALKTQTPELIVLEGFGTAFNFDYSADSRVIKSTYGMRWSKNKIDAICASTKKEDRIGIFLDYARFHSRYMDLNKGDFFPNSTYTSAGTVHIEGLMGQYLCTESSPQTIEDYRYISEPLELWGRTGEYYRKILELAKEKGIPIAVVIVPYGLGEDAYRFFLRAKEIADEYEAGFYDTTYLTDEMGINLENDYQDSMHMTIAGSAKFSKYIGSYLKEKYEISDRRGDERYSDWDRTAELTRHYANHAVLKSMNNLDDIAEAISRLDYTVILCNNGYGENTEEIIEFGTRIGIDNIEPEDAYVIKKQNVIWTFDNNSDYYYSTKNHDVLVERFIRDDILSNKVTIDNVDVYKVTNGINIVVYDSYTDSIADSFGISRWDNEVVR